jgi:hypothetical protein
VPAIFSATQSEPSKRRCSDPSCDRGSIYLAGTAYGWTVNPRRYQDRPQPELNPGPLTTDKDRTTTENDVLVKCAARVDEMNYDDTCSVERPHTTENDVLVKCAARVDETTYDDTYSIPHTTENDVLVKCAARVDRAHLDALIHHLRQWGQVVAGVNLWRKEHLRNIFPPSEF